MRGLRSVASAACVAALVLTALTALPARADEAVEPPDYDATFDQPVPFRPILGRFPTGSLRPSTLRVHRVVVVPLYSSERPDAAEIDEMVRQTREFYAREVPGMTLRFSVTPPVRTSAGNACDFEAAWDIAVARSGFGSLTLGEHVVAVAPECDTPGIASEAEGYGRVYVSVVDGQVLAHEFGHNLGLGHGDEVICTSGGRPVSLSRTCKEYAYENVGDLMGGGIRGSSLLADRRVAAVEQALLTGRVRRIPATGTSTVTVSSRGSGTHAAQVATAFGTVFLDVAADSIYFGFPNSVQAHVATRNGSGLLRLPQADGSMTPVRTGLQLGDSWTIPGTRLRVVVTSLAPTRASLRFSPSTARSPVPAAPVITDPADGLAPSQDEWTLRWRASPSRGIVAYQVQLGESIVARVDGATTEAVVPPVSSPASVVVWAVGENGLRTASVPLRVSPTGDK